MLFVSNANILKYFRAIKSIDFYKHSISFDHLLFIFLHFLLWPQNIKDLHSDYFRHLNILWSFQLWTNFQRAYTLYWLILGPSRKREKALDPCWRVWALFRGQRSQRTILSSSAVSVEGSSLWKWWRNWSSWGQYHNPDKRWESALGCCLWGWGDESSER